MRGELLERLGVAEEVGHVDQQVAEQRADLLRVLRAAARHSASIVRSWSHLHAALHAAEEGLGLVAAEIMAESGCAGCCRSRAALLDRVGSSTSCDPSSSPGLRAGQAAANSTSSPPISSTGMAKSIRPVEIALFGMPGYCGPWPSAHLREGQAAVFLDRLDAQRAIPVTARQHDPAGLRPDRRLAR